MWRSSSADGRTTPPSFEFVLARGREAEYPRSRGVRGTNMTLATFFAALDADDARARPPTTHGLLYHTSPLARWPEALRAEAEAAERMFGVDDAPSASSAADWPAPSSNLWLGQRGVVAAAHYDSSHNYVLQVFGRKTWALWPPDALPALRLHPATHPSRRQTRLQLVGRGNASEAPPLPPAVRVTVAAGEVLYVPPFWAHAVHSDTHSLSLSVLSPSWEEATFARVKNAPLPFGRVPTGDGGGEARAVAAAALLRELLGRADALRGEAPAAFVASVHAARHAALPLDAPSDAAAAAAAGVTPLACSVLAGGRAGGRARRALQPAAGPRRHGGGGERGAADARRHRRLRRRRRARAARGVRRGARRVGGGRRRGAGAAAVLGQCVNCESNKHAIFTRATPPSAAPYHAARPTIPERLAAVVSRRPSARTTTAPTAPMTRRPLRGRCRRPTSGERW